MSLVKIDCPDLDTIIKGIVEGFVFVLQKCKILENCPDPTLININQNHAKNVIVGENVFNAQCNEINFIYKINYQFSTDLINENAQSKCGISLYMYHPDCVKNDQMHFYGTNRKDIKKYIRTIVLTIKHHCTNSCRGMMLDSLTDYDGNVNCEIKCETITHNINANDLIEMMLENENDNRSLLGLPLTTHGKLVEKASNFLKEKEMNIIMFFDQNENKNIKEITDNRMVIEVERDILSHSDYELVL